MGLGDVGSRVGRWFNRVRGATTTSPGAEGESASGFDVTRLGGESRLSVVVPLGEEWRAVGYLLKGAVVHSTCALGKLTLAATLNPLTAAAVVGGVAATVMVAKGTKRYLADRGRMVPRNVEAMAAAQLQIMDAPHVPLDMAPGPVRVEEDDFLPELDNNGAIIPPDVHGVQREVRRRRVRHTAQAPALHHIRDLVVGQVSYLQDTPANRLVITRLVLNAMKEHGMRAHDISRQHTFVVELCFLPTNAAIAHRQMGQSGVARDMRAQFMEPHTRFQGLLPYLRDFLLGRGKHAPQEPPAQ